MPNPLSAKVEMRGDRPTILLNDQPYAPLIYALTDCPGARWTWEEIPARNTWLFAQQGVRLFQAGVFFEHLVGEDDMMDVSQAQQQIAGILAQCPDAAVMLRVHVAAPLWWCAKYPEECVGYADAPPKVESRWGLRRPIGADGERPIRASLTSKVWLAWATRHMAEFCRQLSATPEGDRLFAIQIGGGMYGEWHQYGFLHHDPDTGGAMLANFKQWLQQRCPTEADLAQRWHQPGIRWSDITLPTSAERETTPIGPLRDPLTQQRVIDYFTVYHQATSQSLLALAGSIRQSWPRPILTAAFFCYFYGVFGRSAAGAHLDHDPVLRSPLIDCLCSPQSYTAAVRAVGGSGHARGILGVVRRAGKVWLDEMDQPTSITGCPWDKKFASTLSDDVAVMRRNVLQPVLRGGGQWWFDFGPMGYTPAFASHGNMGWWDDPLLQENVKAVYDLAQSRHGRPFVRPADVLIVHDPFSFRGTVSRRIPLAGFEFGDPAPVGPDPFALRAVEGLIEGLYRSGLVFDEAVLSELPTLDLTPFRLIFFATTPVLDPQQRAFIQQHVAATGRHVAYLGFCGWGDGETTNAALGSALSGFPAQLQRFDLPVSQLNFDGAKEEQALGAPFDVITLQTNASEVIGRWSDGAASAAVRTGADSTQWDFAVAPQAPQMLRAMGRRAGCHVINAHDDATMLGDGLLMIHTADGGARQLHLHGGRMIDVTLPPRSTWVFDAVTGETLLA